MDIFELSGLALYIIIFFAKIIEVSISTLRIVLVSKGEKLVGAILGFFEVLIWLIVVNSVLHNITQDPIKVVVYCLAFSVGNYIGVVIESKLAVGLSSLQVIVKGGNGSELASLLRENNFGVTIIEGQGKEQKREILFIHLKRKRIDEAVKLIQSIVDNAVIIVNETKIVKGGYIKK